MADELVVTIINICIHPKSVEIPKKLDLLATMHPLGTNLSSDDLQNIHIPNQAQLSALQVGQRIAILRRSYGVSWFAAQILQIKEKEIQIKMCHSDDEPDDNADIQSYWIDPALAQISTNESCVAYQDCAVFGRGSIPTDPTYANGQIIMSIGDDESMDPGIYIYDINSDSVSKLCVWPEGARFEQHGIAADPVNNDIYLISGSTMQFAVYNMVTKQWTKKSNELMPDLKYATTIYVPDPVNELYFNGTDIEDCYKTQIMKWSKDTDSLIDIAANLPNQRSTSNFICDKDRNRILIFGGRIRQEVSRVTTERTLYRIDDNLKYEFLDDIHSYCLDEKIWTKLAVKLPRKKKFWIAHGFPSVVIALQRDNDTKVTEIWCLELNTLQWFKSHMRMPLEFIGGDLVVTDDHFLHCLSYHGPAYHLRFDLRDMLPKELFAANLESNMQIISAYCFMISKGDMITIQVPDDVKHLIASFYNALY